jgi:hypothetical protein
VMWVPGWGARQVMCARYGGALTGGAHGMCVRPGQALPMWCACQPRRLPLEPRAVVVAGFRCRGVPFVQTRGRSQEDPWVEVPGA